MSLLLKLPDDIFKCFLSDWISIKYWGMLDIVFTNVKHRPYFLQVMEILKLSSEFKTPCIIKFYQWIYSRNIILNSYVLGRNCISRCGDLLFDLKCANVLELHMDQINYERCSFIGSFMNLHSLLCYSPVLLQFLSPSIMSQLQYLIVDGVVFNHLNVIAKIRDHCVSLISLKLCVIIPHDSAVHNSLFTDILIRNTKLKILSMSYYESVIETLTAHCNNLSVLTMEGKDWDLSCVAQIIKNCRSLQEFKMISSVNYNCLCHWNRNSHLILQGKLLNFDGWESFSQEVTGLSSLTVTECTDVRLNLLIIGVVASCSTCLSSVRIDRCRCLTAETLHFVVVSSNVTSLQMDVHEMHSAIAEYLCTMQSELNILEVVASSVELQWVISVLQNNTSLTRFRVDNVITCTKSANDIELLQALEARCKTFNLRSLYKLFDSDQKICVSLDVEF